MPTPNFDHIPSGDLDIEDDAQRNEWYARFNNGTLSDFDHKPEPTPEPEPAPATPEPQTDPHGTTEEELQQDLRDAIGLGIIDPNEVEEPEPDAPEVIGSIDTDLFQPLRDTDRVEYLRTQGMRGEKNALWRELLLKRNRVFVPEKRPRDLSHHSQAFRRRMRRWGNPNGLRLTMQQAKWRGTWGTVMDVVEGDDGNE